MPDVRVTVNWYQSIGFSVLNPNEHDGDLNWEVVEELHDTFYGAREFIVRDLNGFWVTFGQDIADEPGGSRR